MSPAIRRAGATVPTVNARRYMIQLAKHFGHRVGAEHNDREARIWFEVGEAKLRASPETLMMVVEAADAEGLARLEQVMQRHLQRFAFREPGLTVEWRPGGLAPDGPAPPS